MPAREFLMIPGPTPVPDSVLEAISRTPIGHRTTEFSALLKETTAGLKWLADDTKSDCISFTASGTGALEAAIANIVSPGQKMLSLVCGVFSERTAKIGDAFGAAVERLSAPPGQANAVAELKKRLVSDSAKDIKVVTFVHNETSTGVMNDLQGLAAAVREHGAISIVDAVSSFAAVPTPIDKWGVDVLCTGSQKALMLPPGLSFIFLGPKAWEACSKCTTQRFYFDLAAAKKSLDAGTTPFTPNLSYYVGLKESLRLIRQEGLENVYARHQYLKSILREGLRELGLKLLAADEVASPTITTIVPPEGISADAIRKSLQERFQILVAEGQDDLKGKIFRIGHMGYTYERDVLMILAALKAVLRDLSS